MAIIVDGFRPNAVEPFTQESSATSAAMTLPEALEAAERHRFDLALLDINLPGGVTGTELQKRMR